MTQKPSPVAVIDIGSNSVRLDIRSEASPHAAVICQKKALPRLGKKMTRKAAMGKKQMDKALNHLQKFSRLLEKHNVVSVKAIATAAVRHASNGPAFVEKVKAEAGIDVEVISGEEEAKLTALGVIHGVDKPTGLVVDLGGGSLELVRVRQGEIEESVSLPLGVQTVPDLSAESKKLLRQHFGKSAWINSRIETLFLVGGTLRACARLDLARRKMNFDEVHGHCLLPEEVVPFCNWIIEKKFKNTRAEKAVQKHRLGEMPVGMFILKTLAEHIGAPSVVFSQYGIREGCLAEMALEQHREMPSTTKVQA